jgi:hypothetical protein
MMRFGGNMPERLREREVLNSGESAQSVETKILKAIRSLNYGSVEITIHDSQVVQIERKERFRFDKRS